MNSESILLFGGFYNIGFIIFHILFWKIFNWKKELRLLGIVNKAIIQVLNLSLTFIFIIFAYISIFHSNELLSTSLGNSILVFISTFWFLRAIQQIYFFGLKNKISLILFLIFVLGGVIYSSPILQSTSQKFY